MCVCVVRICDQFAKVAACVEGCAFVRSMEVCTTPVAASVAARTTAARVPKYIPRVAKEADVSPHIAHTIFEHLTQMAIDTLRTKKPFRLHRIASFRLFACIGRPAGTKEIHGHVFKAKSKPASRRVICRVALVLERSVIATSPGDLKGHAQTPALKALCQALATSIGREEITSELVGNVVASLRTIIIHDLRATGVFVLDGLVRFVLANVKARSAAYVTCYGRTVLMKAKGPHRRVYGHAPRCNKKRVVVADK